METSKLKKEATDVGKFTTGAKWVRLDNKKEIKFVHSKKDNLNVMLTDSRVCSKRILNKKYKFVGVTDLTKNKKSVVTRGRDIFDGCFVYITVCRCTERVSGWTEADANKSWDMHFCQ